MCFGSVLEDKVLCASVKKTVAERANAISEFECLEPSVFVTAGFVPNILLRLKSGSIEFTENDLHALAEVIHVSQEFLLTEGLPEWQEMEDELTLFETGKKNVLGTKNPKN